MARRSRPAEHAREAARLPRAAGAPCRARRHGRRRRMRGRLPGTALRVPARPRRAPGVSHRVVVRHRLARARDGRRRRLPGHVLPHPPARRRRGIRAGSRRGSSCSRTPRCPMPTPAGCCTTSAQRARGVRPRRRRRRRRRGSGSATGGWRAPATAPSRDIAAPRRSGWRSPARPRSRCCCRARTASRAKGRSRGQASHYYSVPQLAVSGRDRCRCVVGRRDAAAPGSITSGRARSWRADAVGWDWIGINLDDGGALMAFRMRGRDGAPCGPAATLRDAGGSRTALPPAAVQFTPRRRWRSPRTGASYPVAVLVRVGARSFAHRALVRRPGTRRARIDRNDLLGGCGARERGRRRARRRLSRAHRLRGATEVL